MAEERARGVLVGPRDDGCPAANPRIEQELMAIRDRLDLLERRLWIAIHGVGLLIVADIACQILVLAAS